LAAVETQLLTRLRKTLPENLPNLTSSTAVLGLIGAVLLAVFAHVVELLKAPFLRYILCWFTLRSCEEHRKSQPSTQARYNIIATATPALSEHMCTHLLVGIENSPKILATYVTSLDQRPRRASLLGAFCYMTVSCCSILSHDYVRGDPTIGNLWQNEAMA